MAAAPPAAGINLEYLSAEDWVRSSWHGFASSAVIVAQIFFPVCRPKQAVCCEQPLAKNRRAIQNTRPDRASVSRQLQLPDLDRRGPGVIVCAQKTCPFSVLLGDASSTKPVICPGAGKPGAG